MSSFSPTRPTPQSAFLTREVDGSVEESQVALLRHSCLCRKIGALTEHVTSYLMFSCVFVVPYFDSSKMSRSDQEPFFVKFLKSSDNSECFLKALEVRKYLACCEFIFLFSVFLICWAFMS